MDRACVLSLYDAAGFFCSSVRRNGGGVRLIRSFRGFIKIDMEHLFALFVYPVWNMQAAGLVD